MGWRYADLFETELRDDQLTAEQDRERAFNLPKGWQGYKRRTTTAGQRLEAEVYPVWGKEDAPKIREKKKNRTKDAQARSNLIRAIRWKILVAEANFTEADRFLHLTYREDIIDFRRVQKDVRNFLNRVKRRSQEEVRYMFVIEGGQEKQREDGFVRPHVHMIIHTDLTREELEDIWGKGIARAERLDIRDSGMEPVILYMVKQAWAPGYKTSAARGKSEDEVTDIAAFLFGRQVQRQRMGQSRNLVQPKVRSREAKVSNHRVKLMAMDFENEAKSTMEKLYPGYVFVKCTVYHSDVVNGVYIRAILRKRR